MAEGTAGVVELTPSTELDPQEFPIRIDLSQELSEPPKNATPQQLERYELEREYRGIVKEAGAGPNKGTPYIEAALAAMGYEHSPQPSVDEKISIQLRHPDFDFGKSLTPEDDHAVYLRRLTPIPPKTK